ncbi:uncharacterized protein ARMOST_08390 [Armillaria ostoyae]|uniref:Uncharacterized protein n=1 Tax=Armillaria ostoyae TaxID=47428 RepID=A0A284R8J0_ARMOS|nr:uncharacterized protein ARMOST_08390 [Armillaria ostoyae]
MQFTAKLYCFLLLCAAAAAAPVPTEGSDEPTCPINEREGIEERALTRVCPSAYVNKTIFEELSLKKVGGVL